MRNTIIVDLKLLATGVGLGGLICALSVHTPVCATVGAVGAGVALALRIVEARL
jgi:hypothetical protein